MIIETGSSGHWGGSTSARRALWCQEERNAPLTLSQKPSHPCTMKVIPVAKCDGQEQAAEVRMVPVAQKYERTLKYREWGIGSWKSGYTHTWSLINCTNVSRCWMAVKGAGSDWIKGKRASPAVRENGMSWGAFTGSPTNAPQLDSHTVLSTLQGAVCISFGGTASSWLRCYFFQGLSRLCAFIPCAPKTSHFLF